MWGVTLKWLSLSLSTRFSSQISKYNKNKILFIFSANLLYSWTHVIRTPVSLWSFQNLLVNPYKKTPLIRTHII